MTQDEETREQIQQIFRDVFDRPELTIGRQTTARDVDDWDSLAHINLVDAVERHFRIKFALGELQSLRHVGDMIDLVVRDSGCGIPAEHLPRIFERFYRVDKARSRATGGTGLGLAIVKHAVEQMGGSVDVKSDLGRGTVFTITFPTVQADVEANATFAK